MRSFRKPLTVAVAADKRNIFAHQVENRFDFAERRLRPADHDGKRCIFGADFAA